MIGDLPPKIWMPQKPAIIRPAEPQFLYASFLPGWFPGGALMAAAGGPTDTGFVIAGAGASVNTGSAAAWSNPGNITADDGTNASIGDFSNSPSDDLVASTFGLSVPGGATITGIEVQAQLSTNFGVPSDVVYVDVGKDNATLGTSKSPSTALSSTMTNYTWGGSSDLWGLTWTPAEVNASTFQARIRVGNGSEAFALCDAMWTKIHFTT